jgi:hypothetical protein
VVVEVVATEVNQLYKFTKFLKIKINKLQQPSSEYSFSKVADPTNEYISSEDLERIKEKSFDFLVESNSALTAEKNSQNTKNFINNKPKK